MYVLCHITCVLEVWHISYVLIGVKYYLKITKNPEATM